MQKRYRVHVASVYLQTTRKYFIHFFYSVVVLILVTLSSNTVSSFSSQPQLFIKAEKNKAADESCLFTTFNINNGNMADCLERCLENCRCQSFQICQNTKCQLCSSHKEENSSLLHGKDGCIYATYEMRHLTETVQVMAPCILKREKINFVIFFPEILLWGQLKNFILLCPLRTAWIIINYVFLL